MMQVDVPTYALIPLQVAAIVRYDRALWTVVEYTFCHLDIFKYVRLLQATVIAEEVTIVPAILRIVATIVKVATNHTDVVDILVVITLNAEETAD